MWLQADQRPYGRLGKLHELLAELPQLLRARVVARLATNVVEVESPEAALVQEEVVGLLRVVLCLGTALAAGAGLALPAVVLARAVVLRLGDHRRQTSSGLLLADVGTGDVLVEGREEALEDRVVLAEERGLSDAAGVEGREDDARGGVEPLVQLPHEHHVADLAILVGLRPVELAAINHGDVRALHARLKALELADVRKRGDHATKLLAVDARRHRAKDDAPCRLDGAILEVLNHQVAEQEVAEVVGRKTQLMPVCGPPWAAAREEAREEGAGLVRVGEVDGCIAHQGVQLPPEEAEGSNELPDAVVGSEVQVHHHVAALRQLGFPRDLLALLEVAAGHDNAPLARLRHRDRRGQAEAARGSGDDDGLLRRALRTQNCKPGGGRLQPGPSPLVALCHQPGGAERHAEERGRPLPSPPACDRRARSARHGGPQGWTCRVGELRSCVHTLAGRRNEGRHGSKRGSPPMARRTPPAFQCAIRA
mmetsp:Transcript_92012/g.237418  ORF Transcript_92012/g.237418 Transcript_92012/m.237418 type:complete len:481 (+) Transcript_92012:72-1514(+)